MDRYIGIDAGSISVKLAVMDARGDVIETNYVRHKGNPLSVAYQLLNTLPPGCSLSVTGSAGKLIAKAFGIKPVNEVVALSYSTLRFYPEVKTVIEMGGEDSKLILLDNGLVKEFSMNSVCAAGTGSFLDQQAERLNLSIEDFSEIALRSKTPPRIAGRCSVFAKSDMIHLQQIATPVEDIVAGLCFAVARNFKGSICKNMALPETISFMGGVAANKGMKRAFREVLHTENLLIPEHFAIMPAIGAVLKDMEQGLQTGFNIEKLAEFISSLKDDESGQQPLCDNIDKFNKKHAISYNIHKPDSTEKVKAYLGIDVGSISTNLAVTDEEDRLLAKRYLMTAGRPIEAVKRGLDEIGTEVGGTVNICGVGTTGSGRYMIADFVGADIVKNEITAQAEAAVKIDPGVDTILEIGGQDSKYISIRDGVIVDFEMNKACAAGTGSFLEEQAEKLDISVKEEFANTAFQSKRPCSLGERCTVFMENSLLSKQQRGAPKEDLVSGLSYSIVQNYVNRVVGDRPIGDKVFFQGGVAFNKSVIAAFEKYLDKNIIVPPHHDVTGAIGMAMIAKKHVNGNGSSASSFKGFDLSKRSYAIKSFECKGCDNICEINRVKLEGEETPLYYGSRCEKYDVKRKANEEEVKAMPDLFKERADLLEKTHKRYLEKPYGGNGKIRPRIGIPRIFFFHDLLPYWSTLLWELGFEVVLSSSTNRQIINKGLENIITESCYPHKIAHGHIKDLIDKEVDAVFLPSFINYNANGEAVRSYACPYAQTMPYIAEVAFDKLDIIKPAINMEYGSRHVAGEVFRSLKKFKISRSAFNRAMTMAESAQKEFNTAINERGKDVIGKINERTIVIVGRSYNAFDPGINLEIPKKLSALGVFSIPQDFLPVDSIDISGKWPNMYWRSGQNILKSAEIIKANPKLFALYIGNFSCGPDSFIHRYFNERMAGKPFLQIEIDEHSADAGVITRCEAFLDSISGRDDIPVNKFETLNIISINKGTTGKTVYLPRMSDHAFGLAAAFRMCGLNAEVMDAPSMGSLKIGRRHVSGKECYPCAITTGDMVKKTLSNDFDHKNSVFFMPSGTGPCRFGQYNILQRLVLNDMGLSHVPIYSPNQDGSFYTELGIVGNDFTKQAWRGIVAIDLLMKCLHETRPYEVHKGDTEGLYYEYLFKVYDLLQDKSSDIPALLNEIRRSFSAIRKRNEKRPLIGIIGEIFVRHNAFANENVIKKVEALGGEVWLAPAEEWLYYVNYMAIRKSWIQLKNNPFSRSHLKDTSSAVITRHIKNNVEHEYSKPFEGYLRTLKEPSTKEMFRNALPYLPDSFEGETILSMGKAVDFAAKGASGIISAMPFGCMPGTIVSALLKGFKEDAGIPCLSVAYDGSEANCSEIQLEAFMHQAGNFMTFKA
ncbi:R-phenyllactate dehydratase activator [bacterium BMS3Abin09]|nr:R-phenyllactate dehydratase activator [bacterium BMS3Abin09]